MGIPQTPPGVNPKHHQAKPKIQKCTQVSVNSMGPCTLEGNTVKDVIPGIIRTEFSDEVQIPLIYLLFVGVSCGAPAETQNGLPHLSMLFFLLGVRCLHCFPLQQGTIFLLPHHHHPSRNNPKQQDRHLVSSQEHRQALTAEQKLWAMRAWPRGQHWLEFCSHSPLGLSILSVYFQVEQAMPFF